MLVVALILAAIAVIVFAIDFFRPGTAERLVSLGLGFLAGGFMAFIIDILHSKGKI